MAGRRPNEWNRLLLAETEGLAAKKKIPFRRAAHIVALAFTFPTAWWPLAAAIDADGKLVQMHWDKALVRLMRTRGWPAKITLKHTAESGALGAVAKVANRIDQAKKTPPASAASRTPSPAELQASVVNKTCSSPRCRTAPPHFHCIVCQRIWSPAEAHARTLIIRTEPVAYEDEAAFEEGRQLESSDVPGWLAYLVQRGHEYVWAVELRGSDRVVRACRHPCFREAVEKHLSPADPVRDAMLRGCAPRSAPRLDEVCDGAVFPLPVRVHGPRLDAAERVVFDVEHYGAAGVRSPKKLRILVRGEFVGPDLEIARRNRDVLLHALALALASGSRHVEGEGPAGEWSLAFTVRTGEGPDGGEGTDGAGTEGG